MKFGVEIPFDDAYEMTRKNKRRLFGKTTGNGSSGFERSHNGGFPSIGVTPKFRIGKTDRIFTIGSCFARNIEKSLGNRGYDIITSRFLFPANFYDAAGSVARNGALNAYTPNSMLELVNLVEREDRETCGVLPLGETEYCDMLLSGQRILSLEEARKARAILLAAYRELVNADVVIITLGFTEAWYDIQDRMYVNRSPAGSMRTMKGKDRYRFYNGSPAAVSDTVKAVFESIRRVTQDRAKIVVTVSPVPLHGTFTDRDVVSANLYSKSTLLSAAVSLAAEYSFVDYYPSYEMVTFTQHDEAWLDDGVHVKQECVDKVIETFAEHYFAD